MAKKFLALIRVISQTDSRLHMVDREKFVIGRSPEAEILLISSSVSRKHLAVEIKDENIVIEDLGSSNGSYINDVRLEAGRKYPVPQKMAVRLGNSNETVTFELIEKPVEFEKNYQSLLPKFNQDLQGVMDSMLKDAQAKADQMLREARGKAEQYLQQSQVQSQSMIEKVRAQENNSLEEAQNKASQVLKEAEVKARELVEMTRKQAESQASDLRKIVESEVQELRSKVTSEVEEIRSKARADAEAESAKKLEAVRIEVEKIHNQALAEARDKSLRQVEAEVEMTKNRLREQMLEIKINAQMEADQILQNAHKEASRVKETAVQEFEKLKNDGQKKASVILSDAESEAERIIQHAREASEKLRLTARTDFDEIVERSKTQSAEILQNAENESQQILDTAKKRAQVIVENQEKESALILSQLSQRIQSEAQKEAQRLIKQTEDQIEESKASARKEVLTCKAQKSEIEEQIAFLAKEKEAAEQNRTQLQADIQKMQTEVARLREENEKQSTLNTRLEMLDKQVKTLELQKIQMAEKNAQTVQEFELLKKNTFEELERVRKEEERKLLQIANIKAKEFTQRIEKVVIGDINRILKQKLSSEEVSGISKRLTEELITLFASESFKHEEHVALKKADAGPGLWQSGLFRFGVVAFLGAVVFFSVKYSHLVLKQQDTFTQNLIDQQKEDMRFKPEMTSEYRQSYTDNVLYMSRYLELKNDPKVQDQWALNLNEFFLNDLKLSEEKMVRFIGIESALLKRLATLRDSVDARYLEEGINRMREEEKEQVAKIQQLVGSPGAYSRLRTREKIFLSQVGLSLAVRPAAQAGQQEAASTAAPEVKLGGTPQAAAPTVSTLPPPTTTVPSTSAKKDDDMDTSDLDAEESSSRKSSSHRKPSSSHKKTEAPKRRPYPYR